MLDSIDFTIGSTKVVRKSMLTVKPNDPETERLVEEFLTNGGSIQFIPSGHRGIKITNEVEGSMWGKPRKHRK